MTIATKECASDSSAIRLVDDKPIDGRSIVVPTSAQEPKAEPKEVDVGNLCVEDLLSLKEQDPFLYYSIPGVRRAELHSQEVAMSKLLVDDRSRRTHVQRLGRENPKLLHHHPPKSSDVQDYPSSIIRMSSWKTFSWRTRRDLWRERNGTVRS